MNSSPCCTLVNLGQVVETQLKEIFLILLLSMFVFWCVSQKFDNCVGNDSQDKAR